MWRRIMTLFGLAVQDILDAILQLVYQAPTQAHLDMFLIQSTLPTFHFIHLVCSFIHLPEFYSFLDAAQMCIVNNLPCFWKVIPGKSLGSVNEASKVLTAGLFGLSLSTSLSELEPSNSSRRRLLVPRSLGFGCFCFDAAPAMILPKN